MVDVAVMSVKMVEIGSGLRVAISQRPWWKLELVWVGGPSRVSEVCALRWDQVDYRQGHLHVVSAQEQQARRPHAPRQRAPGAPASPARAEPRVAVRDRRISPSGGWGRPPVERL